jgi:hypothetical protein
MISCPLMIDAMALKKMVLLYPRQIWPVVTVSSALEEDLHLCGGTTLHVDVAPIVALTVEEAVEVVATAPLEMMTVAPGAVMIAAHGAVMNAVVTVTVVMTDATCVVMMVTATAGLMVVDAVTVPPLLLLTTNVRFARFMVIPPRTVGVATRMIRRTRGTKEKRVHILHPMEWTQIGIVTWVPLITSLVS